MSIGRNSVGLPVVLHLKPMLQVSQKRISFGQNTFVRKTQQLVLHELFECG